MIWPTKRKMGKMWSTLFLTPVVEHSSLRGRQKVEKLIEK